MGFKKRIFFIVSCVVFLGGCFFSENYRTPQEIKKSGVLRVITRQAITTYYKNKEGEFAGFEFDLARTYAKHLGVELEIISAPSIDAVLDAVESGRADIAASGLTRTQSRLKRVTPSIPYYNITQQLVCHKDFIGESIKDVVGKKMVVVSGSSYVESLKRLKTQYPSLKWTEVADLSSGQVLQMVWEGGPDCTLVDSHIAAVNRRFMPELNVVQNISEPEPLVWYVNLINKPLINHINDWFKLPETKVAMEKYLLQYFGDGNVVNKDLTLVFNKRVVSSLPKYKKIFQQAGNRYGIDWKLLAAISYQQSGWNENAKDPSGGQGLMLVSPRVVKEYKIHNVNDPTENIAAGAKVLKKLKGLSPDYLSINDQLWLSVAAYNIGWKHIQDARKIAIDMNLNPNKWSDVKTVLPLLSQKHYFNELKYGFAHGIEPVVFVKRVKFYYSKL